MCFLVSSVLFLIHVIFFCWHCQYPFTQTDSQHGISLAVRGVGSLFLQLGPSIIALSVWERVYIITIATKPINQAFLLSLGRPWVKDGKFEFWITIQIWIFLLLSAWYRWEVLWPRVVKSLPEVHTKFFFITLFFSGCQVPWTNHWLLLTTGRWILRQVSCDRYAAGFETHRNTKTHISWYCQCSLELIQLHATSNIHLNFYYVKNLDNFVQLVWQKPVLGLYFEK